jgi:hypothetical protein
MPPLVPGVAVILHLVPSQVSMSARKVEEANVAPTAKQRFAFGHATSSKAVLSPGGFGLATCVNVEPFQRSTRDLVVPFNTRLPTAKQLLALVHATELNDEDVVPGSGAVGTSVHVDPSQRIANGFGGLQHESRSA